MESTNWRKIIKKYNKPDTLKSNLQLIPCLILYVVSWVLGYQAYEVSPWLSLLVIFASLFYFVRIFIIMHDCGHGSFYKSKRARTVVGYITGILTFTPYWQWTKSHATHHKHSGDLDNRGVGDIWTMTVEEYTNSTWFEKLKYRLYRNPLITFVLGPFYVFFIMHRFTTAKDGKKERRSVYITNVALLVMAVGISSLTSLEFYLFFQFILTMLTGILGVLLFFVQHQYEEVYWRENEEWKYDRAALEGSSYLKLPKLLQWSSGNIGFHHIHHLSHSIPNYNLEQAHNENPMFQSPKVLELKDMINCIRLKLYDTNQKKMIRFSELKQTLQFTEQIEAVKAGMSIKKTGNSIV